MAQVSSFNVKRWVKQADHPLAAVLRQLHKTKQKWYFPLLPVVHPLMLRLHLALVSAWHNVTQFCYFTPLFKSRLNNPPHQLHLYSGMPQVAGWLTITIGEGCRISGRSSLFGRTAGVTQPQLQIGKNVDIGWQNTIAVGSRIVLADHVRLAGNVYLAGFPGHPLSAEARARGDCETDAQVGDIVLEENVWLATGVTVLAGVTIGRNSIIAAGSVVTKDIPSNVIAAGVPAKVVKQLAEESL